MSKIKPSKILALKQVANRAGFFLGLFFDPEDGDHMLLRNVG
jgi:hypothetical protein